MKDILVCSKGEETCLCIEAKSCCAANTEQFPIGLITEDGFILKCGLPCCTYGLKKPDPNNLLSAEGQTLCIRGVAQFPFGDKISAPVCAICFMQLMPAVQFMKPAPGGGAPPAANEEMQR